MPIFRRIGSFFRALSQENPENLFYSKGVLLKGGNHTLCLVDHNFWTANNKNKYDSLLERRKEALKHTKRTKSESKIGLDPPSLALTD